MLFSYLDTLLQENQGLLFFLVLGFGYLIGKIKIKGFEFGPVTGVLFTGLAFGHFGYGNDLPVQSFGFIMFIYSVGLQAGPRFFSVLLKDGLRYFILALVVAGSGFAVAATTANLFDLEPGSAAGILAGGLTTTPTLAAAEDAIRSGVISPPAGFTPADMLNNVTTGYAITYLFGLVGLILLIRLIPKITGVNLAEEAAFLAGEEVAPSADQLIALGKIETRAFLVQKEDLVGISFGELAKRGMGAVTVNKIKRGEDFIPINDETALQLGDKIAFIGDHERLILGPQKIGPEIIDKDMLDAAAQSCQIVVNKRKATGMVVSRQFISNQYRCVLSKVTRLGVPVPLDPKVQLQRGDVLSVTGPKANLDRMGASFGHVERNIDETDLLTFAFGIVIGIVIGSISIKVYGIDIGLGTAGGLLSAGLVIGFLRSIYPTFGRMPSAARYVFMELGLLFFMGGVGLRAGPGIVEALTSAGPQLLIAGILTTSLPVFFSYFFGRKVLNINPVLLLGAITGAMTSGACLGIINKEANSTIPSLGYTGAYAFANVFLTVAGSLILFF